MFNASPRRGQLLAGMHAEPRSKNDGVTVFGRGCLRQSEALLGPWPRPKQAIPIATQQRQSYQVSKDDTVFFSKN